MKVRTSLFILALLAFLIFAFLIPISGWVLTLSPLSSANTSTATSPTTFVQPTSNSLARVSPTPTVTKEPSAVEVFVSTTNSFEKDVVGLALAVVNLFAVIVIICLGIFLFWKIIQLTQKSILIIETFTNSTDHDNLNKFLTGLTQLARQDLVTAIEVTRFRINRYKQLGPEKYRPPKEFPVPEGASGDKLNNLLKSLQEVTTGELKTAIQVINLVFPSKGTKITHTLQSKGETYEILGISVEITDLRGQQKPVLYTIWEEEEVFNMNPDSQTAVTEVSSDSKSVASQTLPTNTVSKPIASQTSPTNTVSKYNPMEGILLFLHRRSKTPSVSHQLEEINEAQVNYRLGTIYNEFGALDQAKIYYEEAMKKQPNCTEAEGALKQILKTKKSLEERYTNLLEPVARWLAIELARLSMANYERHIFLERTRSIYRAKVYNFIGEFHFSAAAAMYPFFYQLAIEDYEEATRLYEQWHQPYANLADAYYFMGVKKENIQYQKKSISYYSLAFQHTPQFLGKRNKNVTISMEILHRYYDFMHSHRLFPIPYLHNRITKWIKIERRIMLGKALAQQWLEDKNSSSDEEKAENLIKRYFENQQKSPWSWDETSEMDSALLYDLTIWYTNVFEKKNQDDIKKKARRYLVYSLARDIERKSSAENNSQIIKIMDGKDGLQLVIDILEGEIAAIRSLPTFIGKAFTDQIDLVLQQAYGPKGKEI